MSGTIIHMPTGRLINENEDPAWMEKNLKAEKTVLDIFAPDGRNIFSIRKLVEETDRQGDPDQRAA